MHDGHDPNTVRLVQVNHRIRELAGQRTLCGRTEPGKPLRLKANFLNEPFDFVVQAAAKFGRDCDVKLDGTEVFFVRSGMKNVGFQRPMILRMRADTSSPGMP